MQFGGRFEQWLRRGGAEVMARSAPPLELKRYNPWRWPQSGKFAPDGQGRWYGNGGSAGPRQPRAAPAAAAAKFVPGGGRFGGGGASGDWEVQKPDSFVPGGGSFGGGGSSGDPDVDQDRAPSPGQRRPGPTIRSTSYIVVRGDSFYRIAEAHGSLTAAQLAAINDLPLQAPIQPGQRLILPPKGYVGPRDGIVRVIRNGYAFDIDRTGRTVEVSGRLNSAPSAPRSARLQRAAGGTDRLSTDDGGHFIARRFNGPREAYNHFAQDASFNRGRYRQLEKTWAAALRRGSQVEVRITPVYVGRSLRPARLTVLYAIDGRRVEQSFDNARGGK